MGGSFGRLGKPVAKETALSLVPGQGGAEKASEGRADGFAEWLEVGVRSGWCSRPVCETHDGTPTSAGDDAAFEEEGWDPCIHVVRLYADAAERAAVEGEYAVGALVSRESGKPARIASGGLCGGGLLASSRGEALAASDLGPGHCPPAAGAGVGAAQRGAAGEADAALLLERGGEVDLGSGLAEAGGGGAHCGGPSGCFGVDTTVPTAWVGSQPQNQKKFPAPNSRKAPGKPRAILPAGSAAGRV